MAVRGYLSNLAPLRELEWNPYTEAFHAARRLRRCSAGCLDPNTGLALEWSFLPNPETLSTTCPSCGGPAFRPYRRFLLRAGRRGGKTRSAMQAAIEELTVPGARGWACAPSFPQLEDYVIPAFFAQLPRAWLDHDLTEWNVDNKRLFLPNRSIIEFRSLDDPERGRGQGLDFLSLGEAAMMSDKVWDIIRPSLADRRGIAFLDTSPRGEHNWTHQRFWEPAEKGVPGFWAISYTTADNPTIPPEEIEEARATMPPKMFQQEYLAENVVFEGAIYGDYLADNTVDCDDDQIREWLPEWPAVDSRRPGVVGLDPGTDHPFAGVRLVATEKGIVQVGEYCERARSYKAHVHGTPDNPNCINRLIGDSKPRIGRDRSQAQAGIELALQGIYTESAENKVWAGIQRVWMWMESGQFRIARSTCPQTLAQLRAYRWADNTQKDGQEKGDPQPFKKFDDLPDALRYAFMLWPHKPRVEKLASGVPARDLNALPPKVRADIERAAAADRVTPDGLIRVTDSELDIMPLIDTAEHMGLDESMREFYR